ncbi:MAG: hypothetical protein BWK73_20160 [Thiothrix lacustris]|uniref:Uncharacterized protein n=1 Tax=Thiothrix lacustris TaxID=525917 RepID=A0A1Y1QPR3_9GAMM|nr:MAG: hypothetical protein BWK73_20160 [Thiothrix lacustris]
MRIHLRDFHGLQPNRASRLLDANYAEDAVDAKLWNGQITNFPCPTVHCSPGIATKTITKGFDCCLNWETHANLVQDCGAVFWTGDGAPKMVSTSGVCVGDEYVWGIQAPPQPSVSYTPCTTGGVRYVAYMAVVEVEVGGRKLFSAPSQPTEWRPVCADSEVELSQLVATHPLAAAVHVYRAEAGFHEGSEAATPLNAAWFLAGIATSATFTDHAGSFDTQPAHPLLFEWGNPPTDLHSLVQTDDGVYAGLSGDYLWYTLPGEPMTWSPRRTRHVRKRWGKPLQLAVHGEVIYLLTDNTPVVYEVRLTDTGVRLNRTVIEKHLPLSSLGGTATNSKGIIYPSDSGLVALTGTTAAILSSPWWNKDQWRALHPDTLVGAVHEDAYIFSTRKAAYILEFGDDMYADNKTANLMRLSLNSTIVGASAMTDHDVLYWVKDGVGYRWDRNAEAATCCPFTYRTAVVDGNLPLTLTAAEVHGSPDTRLTVRYYRETEVRGVREKLRELAVFERTPFRLPGTHRNEDTFFELEGCGVVDSVTFATSHTGLRGVG